MPKEMARKRAQNRAQRRHWGLPLDKQQNLAVPKMGVNRGVLEVDAKKPPNMENSSAFWNFP
jgi:hypothetical protein